ncbi:MAG: zinc ribbon domain-containing protein [Cyanobacteria bacterium P01_G01_bin.67]
MAYVATLSDFQQLAIANLGGQTQINLTLSRPGQQQNQSSSFTTGSWRIEPKLFQLGQDYILRIDAEQGLHHILIQQNSVSTVNPPPDLDHHPTLSFSHVPDSTQDPIEFKPMPPMKMGNMSMDINSMSMQMGNMSLQFDRQPKTSENKTFCAQCGVEAKTGDRFCRSCGHELNQ